MAIGRRLQGRNAFITGGTSGIGEATAKLFADEGATVYIIGRDKEKGCSIVNDIIKMGGKANFLFCDISKEEQIENLAEWINNEQISVDILMNNAGVFLTNSLERLTTEEWDIIFSTNVKAAMLLTKLLIANIRMHKGNIINNASISGMQSYIRGRSTFAYSASKAALIEFSQLCALNYAVDGIRVNCICPGVIDTPIFTNRDFSRFDGKIPLGRLGNPSEVANAALFLASDEASYITGAVLTVDGGASLM